MAGQTALAISGGNVFGRGNQRFDVVHIVPERAAFIAWRLMCAAGACTACCCRADRAGHKPSTAVGADILKGVFNAIGTEGAFIAADSGVRGFGRQVAVTKFTIGAQLKHGASYGSDKKRPALCGAGPVHLTLGRDHSRLPNSWSSNMNMLMKSR